MNKLRVPNSRNRFIIRFGCPRLFHRIGCRVMFIRLRCGQRPSDGGHETRRLQPRWPAGVRCSALILLSKPLLVFANIGRKWAGSVTSTSRVTNSSNRCPQDTPTLNAAMKYYTSTTEYNCGIDLHARQMYVCVMDRQDKKLVHTYVRDNDFAYFLKLIEPYKQSLTVCCECMFGWSTRLETSSTSPRCQFAGKT